MMSTLRRKTSRRSTRAKENSSATDLPPCLPPSEALNQVVLQFSAKCIVGLPAVSVFPLAAQLQASVPKLAATVLYTRISLSSSRRSGQTDTNVPIIGIILVSQDVERTFG